MLGMRATLRLRDALARASISALLHEEARRAGEEEAAVAEEVTTARIEFRETRMVLEGGNGRVARAVAADGRLLGRAGGLGALRAGRGPVEGRDAAGSGAYAAAAERREFGGACSGRCGYLVRPRRSRRRRTGAAAGERVLRTLGAPCRAPRRGFFAAR